MRNKRAKEIRKIILKDEDNPTLRRVYRKFKKKYNSVPRYLREDFIKVAQREIGQMG